MKDVATTDVSEISGFNSVVFENFAILRYFEAKFSLITISVLRIIPTFKDEIRNNNFWTSVVKLPKKTSWKS